MIGAGTYPDSVAGMWTPSLTGLSWLASVGEFVPSPAGVKVSWYPGPISPYSEIKGREGWERVYVRGGLGGEEELRSR